MNGQRSTAARRHARLAPALAAVLLLSACAEGAGGAADGPDACSAQTAELDRSGAFFAAPIVAGGVAVIGAGGVLGTRPGVIGALVWGATSAAAAVTAVAYVDQRRREAAGNEAALATAVGNDIDRENAGLAQSQTAVDRVLDCRLQEAARVRAAARAGEIQRQQAQAQLAAIRAQAERDLALSRTIEQRVQARAADLDAGVQAVVAEARPAPPPRPAVTVRPTRPVPLQTAPVAAAPPAAAAPAVAARQEVRIRPARNPDFVAVETPAGQPLGYAPVAVFAIPAAQTRAIAMPAVATGADAAPAGRLRTLASTNIVRRDNFREAVGDLQRAVASGGFELGT
ncbi:hypothetical protein [Roseomonas fluvialis]|uniref:Uncharacterized protein n=1 Tax=Roseomonas fluvialis TaxID=1750527 RepID=A0ABM7Y5N8_9PROT|nr:hypothetical protein [Roseomonas fluvialis]BDG73231.1 hypothetical protein Rmf_31600 [Roseomonas fluvialis]